MREQLLDAGGGQGKINRDSPAECSCFAGNEVPTLQANRLFHPFVSIPPCHPYLAGHFSVHLLPALLLLARKSANRKFGRPAQGPVARPVPVAPDTLFLTWQRDPTTTMTIQWVGPALAPAESVISYAPRSANGGIWLAKSGSNHPYPLTDLKVHRVELEGLAPGTDYQFRIGTVAKTFYFRTMPATATDVIHFVSGGDCGTGSHAVGNNIMAARQDPMFALIGGDLAYENGRSPQTHLAFLRNYSKHMIGHQERMIPMLACIGNHEVEWRRPRPASQGPILLRDVRWVVPRKWVRHPGLRGST